MPTWLMQLQSLLILVLLVFGVQVVRKTRHRKRHVKIMSLAMLWDIFLILQIEISRGAVLKASRALENPLALNIHVSIALMTVVFYGLMIFSGTKVLHGDMTSFKRHRLLGRITLIMRTLTLATSFLVVGPEVP